MLEQITATRYVTPLKEGGSLPGVVEADDCGTYVLKFRGAGQGVKVLVAEVLVGLPGPPPRSAGAAPRRRRPAGTHRAVRGGRGGPGLLNASLGLNLHRLPAGVLRVRRVAATLGRGVRGDPLARRPHRERRPDLEQPQPAGVARRAGHRPRGRALLPPPVAEPGPDPARFAAQPFDTSKHVLADVAGNPRGRTRGCPRSSRAWSGGDGPGARRTGWSRPPGSTPRRRPRGLPGAPAGPGVLDRLGPRRCGMSLQGYQCTSCCAASPGSSARSS